MPSTVPTASGDATRGGEAIRGTVFVSSGSSNGFFNVEASKQLSPLTPSPFSQGKPQELERRISALQGARNRNHDIDSHRPIGAVFVLRRWDDPHQGRDVDGGDVFIFGQAEHQEGHN